MREIKEEEEERMLRVVRNWKRRDMGLVHSLGGRRQALLSLTQHRRLKASNRQDWGTQGTQGTHHLDSGLWPLDFWIPPLELIKKNLLARCRIGQAGLSVCRRPRKEDILKCLVINCPMTRKAKPPPSDTIHTSLRCNLVLEAFFKPS